MVSNGPGKISSRPPSASALRSVTPGAERAAVLGGDRQRRVRQVGRAKPRPRAARAPGSRRCSRCRCPRRAGHGPCVRRVPPRRPAPRFRGGGSAPLRVRRSGARRIPCAPPRIARDGRRRVVRPSPRTVGAIGAPGSVSKADRGSPDDSARATQGDAPRLAGVVKSRETGCEPVEEPAAGGDLRGALRLRGVWG